MPLTKINGPSDPFPPSLETITFSTWPVEWNSRHAPIELKRNETAVQNADPNAPIGEPSPLSSPLGPLSESPESESSGFQDISLPTHQPLRGSVDSLSSGYESLTRSVIHSLFSHSRSGLGPVQEADGFTAFPPDPRYSRVIMDSVHPGWIVFASNHREF